MKIKQASILRRSALSAGAAANTIFSLPCIAVSPVSYSAKGLAMSARKERFVKRLIQTLSLVALLSLPTQAQERETNHCDDPAAWADWDARVQQHPADQELQVLHALWMGLCFKVDRGELALDDAITTFERAQETLIQQRKEEKHTNISPPVL